MADGLPGTIELDPEVVAIATTLEQAGHETWAVGGALRDRLLGDSQSDVDLATAATPDQVQALFRRTVAVGVAFGTVGVLDGNRRLHEVTTFRRDVETDGRHATVVFGASLDEDLARRDFTINAIAFHPIRHQWRDPFGGWDDLRAGVVRAVGEPGQRFREDYLRILRAIRFALRFGFTIEPATWEAAVAAAPGLAHLSAERVREEWFKQLRTARSLAAVVDYWQRVGAAAVWLPELVIAWPEGADPLARVRDVIVLTVMLVSDPVAVLERLRCSREEIGRAAAMTRGPRAPAGDDPAAVRRWMRAAGPAVDDLMALRTAESGAEPAWGWVVRQIREREEATSRAELAVTGDDLRGAGIEPGPGMGVMLDRLLDLVIEDPALNTRQALLDRAREWR